MANTYTQGIYIDGTYYDVPLVAIKRTGISWTNTQIVWKMVICSEN